MHHSKSTSQYDSTGNQLSLSKNIYGIRDAFRNVINISFGGGWDDPRSRNSAPSAMSVDNAASTPERHVVSLAGCCAIVVGKELGMGQEGDRVDEGESTDDEKCGNEEGEMAKWVDGIYEEIPFHIRRHVPLRTRTTLSDIHLNFRWVVVSHALQIILQSCPPHPTLLYLLLEVFTTHLHSSDMIPLANTILRQLITVSFTSPSNPTAITPLSPPICHAAHPTFLTSLLSLWRNSSFGDSETFLSVLLDVSVYGTAEAWTSRAVSNLAKELSNENFSSLVRMTARLIEIMAQSNHKTSKVDKRPTERRMALLLRWLQQIFDRLIHTDYVEGDTGLCLRCLELISVYFGSGLGIRLLTRGGKPANEVDSAMINITTWFLAVSPPAFSPIEDSRRLIQFLRSSDARPAIFAPLITRFFESVSDDEVPWDMLDQLHSFASALNSNELYELELSMVKQIQEEFQTVFGVTLGYEPEYERIMRDLQESIENAEGALGVAGHPSAQPLASQLISPFVTPLVPRRRYIPLPQSRRTHRRDSSPTLYHQPSQSQSPPPLYPTSSKSKSRTTTPPTSAKLREIPPVSIPQPPPSRTPLMKRKHVIAYVELTPWVVKKRRMFAQGQSHSPKNPRAPFGDHTDALLLDTGENDLGTHNSVYPQNRLVRVVDKERHSSAETASSCSPTPLRTRLIASRRCNRAPSPSPGPYNGEDDRISETSEGSGDSEGEGSEFGFDEGDSVLPTSDDPLNLFALSDSSPRLMCNMKLRPRPPLLLP